MSSNLPPGVTDSMIPGNRPEDAEFDAKVERITDRIMQAGPADAAWLDVIDDNDLWWALVEAYDLGAESRPKRWGVGSRGAVRGFCIHGGCADSFHVGGNYGSQVCYNPEHH